jgi:hypothetical protein
MIAQRNHSVFSRRPSVNPEFRLRRPAPPCVTTPTPAAPRNPASRLTVMHEKPLSTEILEIAQGRAEAPSTNTRR